MYQLFKFEFDKKVLLMFRAGHFALSEGIVQDKEGEDPGSHTPTVAAFYPSLTMLTSQNHMCVALSGGNILKFDLTSVVYDDQSAKPITVFKTPYKVSMFKSDPPENCHLNVKKLPKT